VRLRGSRICLFAWSVGVIVNATRITVNPENRTELFQTISRLLEPVKSVQGCRTVRFYLDAVDENSSLLMSEWDTELDLNNYLHSNNFAILQGAITVLSIESTDSKAVVTSQASRP
jgi:quinol monooxygenase YgiN